MGPFPGTHQIALSRVPPRFRKGPRPIIYVDSNIRKCPGSAEDKKTFILNFLIRSTYVNSSADPISSVRELVQEKSEGGNYNSFRLYRECSRDRVNFFISV